MKPSATGMMSAQADTLRQKGIPVINFAAGDPVLPNHPAILEAAEAALQEGNSPYAPVAGLLELRTLAADWMNRRYQATYTPDETLVTCGGKFGLYAALQALLHPQDEVLIPAPYWVSYPDMVRLALGTPKPIPTTPSTAWKLTPHALKAHLSPQSKVLILNNACNPTGALYTRRELAALLKIAQEANLTVLSDEVYSELVFTEEPFISCASFPEHRSHTLVIESCSKNFGMPGWRVGFAFGPAPLIAHMAALQSHSTTGTSFLSQKAAIGALRHADAVSTYVRDAMRQRRACFINAFLSPIDPPPAALYYFAKIQGDSLSFCQKALEESHVALVPGSSFGMEGYVRFAFTETEAEILRGLTALQQKEPFPN